MMTTAPNAIAWKVAAALAGDADWARWARGETAEIVALTAVEMKWLRVVDDFLSRHNGELAGMTTNARFPRRFAEALRSKGVLDCAHMENAEEGRSGRLGSGLAYFLTDSGRACLGTPVPAPWDADAYRADCWRRNVEPGPLPSLSWTGEDGFGWRVIRTGVVFYAWADHIATWDPDDDVLAFVSAYPRELVARIVTLATAAKRALR